MLFGLHILHPLLLHILILRHGLKLVNQYILKDILQAIYF